MVDATNAYHVSPEYLAGHDNAATNEAKVRAEQLGCSPILLRKSDEGGRQLQIDGGLILHKLIEWPFKKDDAIGVGITSSVRGGCIRVSVLQRCRFALG